jgi:hypothetical protein
VLPAEVTAKMKPRLSVTRNINIIRRTSHIRRLIAFSLILFVSNTCRGTTIVLINKGDTIWIGTDSLQSTEKKSMRLACKINDEKTFYWAVASPLVADRLTGFDFGELVHKAHLRGDLENKLRMFISTSKAPLSSELSAVKEASPDFFAHLMTLTSLFTVLFVSVEGGNPRFTWVDLKVKESAGKIEIVSEGPQTAKGPLGFLAMGETDAANAYVSLHMREITDDPAQLIRDSINAEISAKPDRVNGPISIARLDATGFEIARNSVES